MACVVVAATVQSNSMGRAFFEARQPRHAVVAAADGGHLEMFKMSKGNAVLSGRSRRSCGQICHVLDSEYEYLEMPDAAKRNIREIFVVEQHAGDYRRLRRPPLG